MLRLRFSPDDLVRVRVCDAIDPMWEIVGSIQVLQLGLSSRTLVHAPWLRRCRDRLQDRRVQGAARALATAAPQSTYFPDFLTPDRHTSGLDDDLDAVLSTPTDRMAAEISRLRHTTGWLDRMAAGDRKTLDRFGGLVRLYHRELIAPDLDRIEAVLAGHRAGLWRQLMTGGTEQLLDSLGATIRWRPPYLEARYPVDRTVELRGRGLLLVPSYFCLRMPTMLADQSLSPVLVYPVEHPETELVDALPGDGLAELVGSTRAAVLQSLTDGANTSEVARRVGISVATASHHTSVLRDAGLISSTRVANRVVHSLSGLGSALISGGVDPGRGRISVR